MKKITTKTLYYILLLFTATACFEIPEEGTISDGMAFSIREIPLTLGCQQIIGEGYSQRVTVAGTVIPFQFSIDRVIKLNEDGSEGDDVTAIFTAPVKIKIWTANFTQKEKTREELEAKRTTIEVPILSFTKANELFFNRGNDDTKPGKYQLDIKVTNSSGYKVFKNMLRVNISKYTSHMSTVYKPIVGTDSAEICTLEFNKKSADKEQLSVKIIEKDGTVVPTDSLIFSEGNGFKDIFQFGKTDTPNQTTFDMPFPVPFVPSNINYAPSASRGKQINATRYGYVMEWVDKIDETTGQVVLDPITNEPVKEYKPVKKARYQFKFYFIISEPGDWEITIRMQ